MLTPEEGCSAGGEQVPQVGSVVPARRGLSVLYRVSICGRVLVPFAQFEEADDRKLPVVNRFPLLVGDRSNRAWFPLERDAV